MIYSSSSSIHKVYGKSLEKAIVDDTSSHFKHVLVSLLTALRPTGNTVDRTQAKLDAQSLLEAGEKKWGTDEVEMALYSSQKILYSKRNNK